MNLEDSSCSRESGNFNSFWIWQIDGGSQLRRNGGGVERAFSMPKVVSSNLGCDPVVRVVSSHLTVILDIHVSAKPETQMRAHLAAVIIEFPGVRLKVLPHFKLLILKGNSYFNVHKSLSSTRWTTLYLCWDEEQHIIPILSKFMRDQVNKV